MSRSARLRLAALALLGACAAGQQGPRSLVTVEDAATLAPTTRTGARVGRAAAPTRVDRGAVASRPRGADRAAVRATIARDGEGTYLDEILLSRDSSLARWPERTSRPLRVWVEPTPAVAGFQPRFADEVRDAFGQWTGTGIPVRFEFVAARRDADVKVTWVERFNERMSGKTLWTRDQRWWIVDAQIILAVHHSTGVPLDAPAVRAIALHEVGHLLGLDHTRDSTTIMTPRVRARDLTAADRATVRLLYSLPPGSVR